MRVAIIVKDFPPDVIGGTETQTKRMAAALSERGHEVTVFTKRYGEHEDDDLPFEVIRVFNLRVNPFVSTLTFLFACTVALMRRIDDFDVCQCMMIYPNGFLGYVVKRLSGLPYLAWIRGGDYYFMKDVWWKRWMIRRVLADTTVLVQGPSIGQDVRNEFPGLDLELPVLGNGVEIPENTADGEGILYLGRLAPKKGVDVLLRAMEGVEGSLTVVGSGPERDRLEELAVELDISAAFVGEVPPKEVDRYYRDSKIYCLPSKHGEGLPNTVLEAMAWGLPCVTTNSGGLPSLVGCGERGCTVPPNDVQALREALQSLLAEPATCARLGRNAREYVIENHSWDVIISSLEDEYETVVESSGNRPGS